MEKDDLIKKVKENISISELAKYFNKSKTSIRYWLKKYNLKTNGYKKSHVWEKEFLIEAISNSECQSDVLRYMNISTKSGNFQTLKRYCLKYQINIDSLKLKNHRGCSFNNTITNEEIFTQNSKASQRCLRDRIEKKDLLKYECQECGNTGIWKNKKLKLQIDHINGINNDNRLENLRYLCPNCHSQTETYCKGNK